MTNKSKKAYENINRTNEKNIKEMAEYCANQAVILQEKAFNKTKDIGPGDLSPLDALFYFTEGARLERLSLEVLDQKGEHTTKYRAEDIHHQQAILNKLEEVNVEDLPPRNLLKYYLEAVSIERVCRGLPAFTFQDPGQ